MPILTSKLLAFCVGLLHALAYYSCAVHAASYPVARCAFRRSNIYLFVSAILQAGGGYCLAPSDGVGAGRVDWVEEGVVQDILRVTSEAVGVCRPLAHLALRPQQVHRGAADAGMLLTLFPALDGSVAINASEIVFPRGSRRSKVNSLNNQYVIC